MKKILFILALVSCSLAANSQTLNPFPTTDSLRKYINKWVRNSPIDAFTNLRLNTALHGLTRFVDSVYGGQVTAFTYSADTLRLTLLNGNILKVPLPSASGNSNLGAGFRLIVPSSQGIKTLFAGNTVVIDSTSNANGITFKVDTTVIATLYDITLKANQQAFIDSVASLKGQISDSLVFAVQSSLVVSRLEFIKVGSSSATYQNDTLIGTQLINVSLEGTPLSFLPRSGFISMSFDSTTGTITLTNGVFSADDYVLILYRSPPMLMLDENGKPIRDSNGNFIILN